MLVAGWAKVAPDLFLFQFGESLKTKPSRPRLNFADTFRNRYMLYMTVNNGHWCDSLRLSPFQTKRPDKRIAPHCGSQSGDRNPKRETEPPEVPFQNRKKRRSRSTELCQSSCIAKRVSPILSLLPDLAFPVSSFASFIVVSPANGAHFSLSLLRSNNCSRIGVSVLQGTSSSIEPAPVLVLHGLFSLVSNLFLSLPSARPINRGVLCERYQVSCVYFNME